MLLALGTSIGYFILARQATMLRRPDERPQGPRDTTVFLLVELLTLGLLCNLWFG
jgi:hypothetical protein